MKKRAMKKCRKNERGAVLVSVLLISILLLAAGSVLLLEAALNSANVTDATAEQQAYYAAESGIQSVLNVLRGNVPPSPLFDTSQAATAPVNRIDFKKAINLSYSNASGDTSTSPRLSRWMTYSSTATDRVTLGVPSAGTYDAFNGFAYSVTVSDPDNVSNSLTFRTSGNIGGAGTSKTFGNGANTTLVTYTAKATTTLNVSGGSAATDFGIFTVIGTGAGAMVDRTRFVITVFMTAPYNVTKEIRGYLEPGASAGTMNILYDSKTFVLSGSQLTVTTPNDTYISQPNADPARFGFLVPGAVGGVNVINGSMTAPEPTRLLVKSTGYGPRNAKKTLEAVVQKNFFNGLSSPATLLLVGGGVCSVFNPGSSATMEYSGNDVASTMFIPPIGTTNDALLGDIMDSVDGRPPHPFNGDVIGVPSNVSSEMPFWLQTATNLNSTMMDLKSVAQSSGRYFNSSTAVTGGIGNNTTATGITYKEGDFEYTGDGGGLLIVTGKLTLKGNFNFNGLILVTGAQGIDRLGAGTGILQGNIIVAPYDPANLSAGFSCPQYDLSGGGNSTITYNSSSIANGMTAVSNFVLGVAEK
jgi:hypothetical protein